MSYVSKASEDRNQKSGRPFHPTLMQKTTLSMQSSDKKIKNKEVHIKPYSASEMPALAPKNNLIDKNSEAELESQISSPPFLQSHCLAESQISTIKTHKEAPRKGLPKSETLTDEDVIQMNALVFSPNSRSSADSYYDDTERVSQNRGCSEGSEQMVQADLIRRTVGAPSNFTSMISQQKTELPDSGNRFSRPIGETLEV